MIQIDKVDIYYFRSIYTLKLKNLIDITILSGKNDCGKSNILKSLNLFFNNETDWQTPFNFLTDFSKKRLNEVRKESIKGKQFIRIQIQFVRGNKSEISLPEKFTVTKTWYRNSLIPEIKTSIEKQFENGEIKSINLDRSQAFVQNYLNRIRFEYIPAIKDRSFFNYGLGLLQDIILESRKDKSIEGAIQNLNKAVEEGTIGLKNEFLIVSGIKTEIKLPESLASLFRAFYVGTSLKEDSIPLLKRGDGVQSRFIPSLLHHISSHSKYTYIWGFEEPENCLEHQLVLKLADDIRSLYSKPSQVILTSHSTGIISLESNNVKKYRIFKKNDATDLIEIFPERNENAENILYEELGLLELQRKQQEEFILRQKELAEEKKQLENIKNIFLQSTQPILLTEGASDPTILKKAWESLYPREQIPFRILSCNTNPPDISEAAGASMLKATLNSTRTDEPKTIGMFDYDLEGIKEYDLLNANFINKPGIKYHKNGKCAAFCIPFIPNRKEYYENKNLPIEFLFPDEYIIKKRDDGHGLEFKQEKKIIRIGNISQKIEDTTEPYFRRIVKNKVCFANDIITKFENNAFENFKYIFDLCKKILKELKD